MTCPRSEENFNPSEGCQQSSFAGLFVSNLPQQAQWPEPGWDAFC